MIIAAMMLSMPNTHILIVSTSPIYPRIPPNTAKPITRPRLSQMCGKNLWNRDLFKCSSFHLALAPRMRPPTIAIQLDTPAASPVRSGVTVEFVLSLSQFDVSSHLLSFKNTYKRPIRTSPIKNSIYICSFVLIQASFFLMPRVYPFSKITHSISSLFGSFSWYEISTIPVF